MNWAKKHTSWKDEWISVLFSDENKFNLDGPDGNKYYWHDLRKEPQCFFSRQLGGGSVMTWKCFGFNGVCEIAFISGRQKATDYQNTLGDYFLPVCKTLGGSDFIFQ